MSPFGLGTGWNANPLVSGRSHEVLPLGLGCPLLNHQQHPKDGEGVIP